jgi:hypothetical protein
MYYMQEEENRNKRSNMKKATNRKEVWKDVPAI